MILYRDYELLDEAGFQVSKHFPEVKEIGLSSIIRDYLTNNLFLKTIVIDGEVVGFSACRLFMPHSAEVTFILSDKFYDITKTDLKLFLRVCRSIIQQLDIDRIQATCYNEHLQAGKLLRSIGFKKEATLKKAGFNKKDLDIYSRVK